MKIRYYERELQVQIWIDVLLRCYPYPISFYEEMNGDQIKGMYHDRLGDMVEKSEKAYKQKNGIK
jgi:hypothetical protein